MTYSKFILLPIFLVLSSACTKSRNSDDVPIERETYSCAIKPELVRSWAEYGKLIESEMPFVKVYSGCDKKLIYVAADHGNDPKSETYKMIEGLFENNPIDFAVVEGFPSDMGLSPNHMILHANKMRSTLGDSETALTIRLAVAKDANFQGGEPSDLQIVNELSKERVAPVDILGFYIVRQIPQLRRSGRINSVTDPRLNDEIFNIVESFSESTGISFDELKAVDGLAAFSTWYQSFNGLSFIEHYRDEDAWPAGGVRTSRPTNMLSDKVANARDRHIISVIDEAMRAHSNVIVVYGGSHHTIQEPALRAAFK